MAYKTFEDMKHEIPEGATHYSDECDSYYFTWFKFENEVPMLLTRADGFWVKSAFERDIKPIPQTETPEEKEALDMTDTTSKQVESLANNSELPNGSEWKSGDKCVINRRTANGELLSDVGRYYGETDLHYWLHGIGGRDSADKSGNIYCKSKYWISKPEAPQQRELKRIKSIEAMVGDFMNQELDSAFGGKVAKVCAALYDAGYRKAK